MLGLGLVLVDPNQARLVLFYNVHFEICAILSRQFASFLENLVTVAGPETFVQVHLVLKHFAN